MKTIRIETLTNEAFAPFGTFYDFENPDGYFLQGMIHRFYPDRLIESYYTRIGFSSLVVKKSDCFEINAVEYHTTTPEIIMPLTGDMIVHVAPASGGVPIPNETRAFLVPKHTMIKINTAIWHMVPFPAGEIQLTALILLPECAYMNDIKVVDLEENERLLITGLEE